MDLNHRCHGGDSFTGCCITALPPALGVTSQVRTGSLRDHGPVLCLLSYSHRAQRRNRTSMTRMWAARSPVELAELKALPEGLEPPPPDPQSAIISFSPQERGTGNLI